MRLKSIASSADRWTAEFLSGLNLSKDAVVSELGSGNGTIASWIARNIAPQGHVDAVDLVVHSTGDSNVFAVCRDVRHYVPESNPVLVHARFVFGHLDDCVEQVERTSRYLRRRGYFVTTEPALCDIPPGAPESIRAVFHMYNDWIRSTGMSLEFAQLIPTVYARCGLSEIGCVIRVSRFGRGSEVDVWSGLIHSVEPRLLERGLGRKILDEFYALA